MRSPGLALFLLIVGMLTALAGLVVMLGSGFLALLINPHGGLYGGSEQEVATFGFISLLSGAIGFGALLAATWGAVVLLQKPKPPPEPKA